MPGTKLTIFARVVKIHPAYKNESGKNIRTIDVTAIGTTNRQDYCLTEVELKLRGLVEGTRYEFICYLNGLRKQGTHVNDLLICKAYHLEHETST